MSSMIPCPDKGTLRAYLDSELATVERATAESHLASCRVCSDALGDLRAQASTLSRALEGITVPQPSFDLAWQRFRAQRILPTQSLGVRWKTMWQNIRCRSWRPALVGATLIALLVSVVFIPPLRSAASEFLGIFRVRKFAIVSFNPAQLERLSGFEQQIFSNQQIDAGNPTTAASADEASRLAGFRVMVPGFVPAGFTAPGQFSVTAAGTAQTDVNLAAARAMLQAAGLPTDAIPTDREQVHVTAKIPPVVTLQYTDGMNALTIVQAGSPEVNVPAGFDLAQLGTVGLQLLGLSPDEAQRLGRSINWATTLVIPVPSNIATVQEITVRGTTGYVFRSVARGDDSSEGMVVWEANDMLYAVTGDLGPGKWLQVVESLR